VGQESRAGGAAWARYVRGMASLARTPEPPYLAVIFTSIRTPTDAGYDAMAAEMDRLVTQQDGYLGHDSARSEIGMTVSYWRDEDAARAWKQVAEHLAAQRRGRAKWYLDYEVRIATVHRAYSMGSGILPDA
jgi:heme-degrading monooxygenase HmoA